MEIVGYRPELAEHFVRMNREWIRGIFGEEPPDTHLFEHLDDYIARGSMVLFGIVDGEVACTGMAMDCGDGLWEICKLTTRSDMRGRGYARGMLRALMGYAREHGARRLFILSNTVLEGAIRLYRSEGFVEVPLSEEERERYGRVDIQLEYAFPETFEGL